jgi:hypothetical protein
VNLVKGQHGNLQLLAAPIGPVTQTVEIDFLQLSTCFGMIRLQAQLHLKSTLLFVEALHLVKTNGTAKVGPKQSWLCSQSFVEFSQGQARFCLLQKLVSLSAELKSILLGWLWQPLGLLHAHELLTILLKHLRIDGSKRFGLDPLEDLRSMVGSKAPLTA